jgi:predicted anti-sigma-YlaC factor YlaD
VINCKDAIVKLWEYLDQNLERLDENDVEEHLGVCRHCCGELEFAKQLRDLLGRPSDIAEVTPEVRSRLEAFVKGLRETE